MFFFLFSAHVCHLDVGCVEVPQGGQCCRQTVCAAVHPHCLKNAGGHTCLLTQTLQVCEGDAEVVREREGERGRVKLAQMRSVVQNLNCVPGVKHYAGHAFKENNTHSVIGGYMNRSSANVCGWW